MGTGASNTQVKRHNTIHQLPTLDPLRQEHAMRPPVQDQNSSQPWPPSTQPKQNQQPNKHKPEWPLPPTHFNDVFDPNWPTNPDRYSLKRVYNAKVTQTNKKLKLSVSNTLVNHQFHQKETSSNQWKKDNSSIFSSAHVQSSLKTQSHSCINLSTAEEIDQLLLSLNEIHSQIDENIGSRQKIISTETKLLIDMIINDTRDVQQNLLAFAQQRQTIQDQLYNEWLQMYVAELDVWKSGRLAELQEDLEKHQRKIMMHSQQLITKANAEANRLRDEAVKHEQTEAAVLIQDISDKIQTMSTRHLGTETMTKINLIIHGNVGTKAPGQVCAFDFDDNNSNTDNKQNHRGKSYPSKQQTTGRDNTNRKSIVSRLPVRKPTQTTTTTIINERTIEEEEHHHDYIDHENGNVREADYDE